MDEQQQLRKEKAADLLPNAGDAYAGYRRAPQNRRIPPAKLPPGQTQRRGIIRCRRSSGSLRSEKRIKGDLKKIKTSRSGRDLSANVWNFTGMSPAPAPANMYAFWYEFQYVNGACLAYRNDAAETLRTLHRSIVQDSPRGTYMIFFSHGRSDCYKSA